MMMVMTPMMMQIMIDAMTTCAGGSPCGLKVCDTVARVFVLAKTFPDGLKYDMEEEEGDDNKVEGNVDNNNDEQVDISNEEDAKTVSDEEDVENDHEEKVDNNNEEESCLK